MRVQYGRFTDSVTRRGPYIVMDYFQGESLQKYLDRTKQGLAQSLPDFLAVAMPVARALHAAHLLGIYHRDVKPDNVLARRTGSQWDVRLIDFGLAVKCEVARNSQVAPRKSLQGLAAAGTADFAAPEQMGKRGDPIGPWSDVYGFGRFCSYALFRTTTLLRAHWLSLPEKLAELIEHCLHEAPGDRYQAFEPIVALLAELQNPQTNVAATPKATETVRPQQPQSPPIQQRPSGQPFTNSVGMEFVTIKPGRFQMGSPESEHQHESDETQHSVTLTKGYYLQSTLVTQKQWQAVMGSNPSNFKGDDNLPVENVNWLDAVDFCNKLSAKEGQEAALPHCGR